VAGRTHAHPQREGRVGCAVGDPSVHLAVDLRDGVAVFRAIGPAGQIAGRPSRVNDGLDLLISREPVFVAGFTVDLSGEDRQPREIRNADDGARSMSAQNSR
jgi:hypothetical protein